MTSSTYFSYLQPFIKLGRIVLLSAPAWFAHSSAASNLIDNPGFDAYSNGNFQYWQVLGSATCTRVGSSGAYVAQCVNRASKSDGLKQNIKNDLLGLGSGVTVTTRFRINPTAVTSARARLMLVDSAGTRDLILAEQVLRTAGNWFELEGVATITWTGTLSQAVVFFEVAQLAEINYPADYPAPYPSLSVDDVRIDLDNDADRLWNSEETSAGTSSSDSDSDNDRMPDGWELHHGLNPMLDDAASSLDADGVSNFLEYYAASDPNLTSSVPATIANAAATTQASDVFAYLLANPASANHAVLIGQHCSFPNTEYSTLVEALHTQTEMWPAVLQLQYDDGTTPVATATANDYAKLYGDLGGLVEIKWSPMNPWTGSHYGVFGSEIDLVELITPNTSVNDTWLSWLDAVADGLQQLQDLGIVVLFRPMSEMNGSWFWWGARPQSDYVGVWQDMYDYFTSSRNLNNLIWVYESDGSVHSGIPADYYYPGAGYVDVMGHNMYSDSWVLTYDLDAVYRSYAQIYAFPQAGPETVIDGTFDNLTMINGAAARFPRVSYFGAWNSFTNNGTTHNLAIIDNLNADDLMQHSNVATLSDLPF